MLGGSTTLASVVGFVTGVIVVTAGAGASALALSMSRTPMLLSAKMDSTTPAARATREATDRAFSAGGLANGLVREAFSSRTLEGDSQFVTNRKSVRFSARPLSL